MRSRRALSAALLLLLLGTGGGLRKADREVARADAALQAGDVATATVLYEEIVARWSGDTPVERIVAARARAGLATCAMQQNRFPEAIAGFEAAIGELEAVLGPDDRLLVDPLKNLGLAYWYLGDTSRALTLLERGVGIAERDAAERPLSYSAVLANYGIVAMARGDYANGLGAFQLALQLEQANQRPGDPMIARAHGNVGYALTLLGDYAGGKTHYEAALAIFEAAYGPHHHEVIASRYNLAVAAHGMGDLETAKRAYLGVIEARRGLQIVDPTGDAAVLGSLSGAELATGDAAAAAKHAEEGLRLLADRPGHPYAATLWMNLVSARGALGDAEGQREAADGWLAAAETQLEAAAGVASERERQELVFTQRSALDQWLVTHARPEDAKAAWTAVLRWKGATARAMLGEREAALISPDLKPTFDALSKARAELAAVAFDPAADPARVLEIVSRRENLQRELAAASQRFAVESAAPDAAAICAALPEASALVDVLAYNGSYLAFVVGPDCQPRRVELGPAAPIHEAVSSWHGRLGDPALPTRQVDAAGGKVRELLWDPLAIDAKTVVVAPDQAAAWVSYAALPLPDRSYVVERHTVAYVESAVDLLRWTGAPAGKGAAIVGGVDYSGVAAAPCVAERFAPLPGTTTEAARVASRLPGAEVLTGSEATEARVAALVRGKRVVHLATHGFFASGSCEAEGGTGVTDTVVWYGPMVRSGVVLAAGGGDGLWTAEEVLATDLRGAELVVLSACETSLGVTPYGDSILGLRRAFAMAGARVLVTAHWTVGDADALALSDGLYRDLPGRSAAEALARSQRAHLAAMRKEWGEARPQAWGAFVAIGPMR